MQSDIPESDRFSQAERERYQFILYRECALLCYSPAADSFFIKEVSGSLRKCNFQKIPKIYQDFWIKKNIFQEFCI